MGKKSIAIIFGGCNTEYEVSLSSAYSVIKHMNKNLYNIYLVGITQKGEWFLYKGPIENIKNNTWFSSNHCNKAVISPNRSDHGLIVFKENSIEIIHIDCVLPILHGKNGEDGTLQGLIELSGIQLIGCNALSSAICMDKDIAHTIIKSIGIKVAPSVVIKQNDCIKEKIAQVETLQYPLFVKPVKSGSSIGITKVHNKDSLIQSINTAFTFDDKVIVEEMIKGVEVGCAILGNSNPIVGEVDEVEVLSDFLNYDSKYLDSTSIVHVPARIDSNVKTQIRETALKIYKALDCKDFARIDMFLSSDGNIYFNEVNTIPGFTPHSRYPSMLNAVGLSFEEILNKAIAESF